MFPLAYSGSYECTHSTGGCRCNVFECDAYKLYIQLRRIVDFCYSTSIEKQDLASFDEMVAAFLFNLAEMEKHVTIKPHNMVHYTDSIIEHGPLFYLATLKYERLHQLLKSFIMNSKNYTCLALQMTKQWLIYFFDNSFVEKNEEKIFETYSPSELQTKVDQVFMSHIDSSIDLTVLKSVTIKSIQISPDFVFLYKNFDDNCFPSFVKVCKIFKQNGAVKFVGKKLITNQFIKKLYSFSVGESDEIVELDLFNLNYHKRLLFGRFNELSLVVKTFYIPDQFSKHYDYD